MAEFELNVRFAGEWAQQHGGRIVDASTRIVRDAIVDEMEQAGPRSGRTYKKPGTSTEYVASAPGEPPAIREGVYANSWSVTPPVIRPDYVIGFAVNPITVGGVALGLVLEEGSSDGTLQPRPHIRPGLERARGRVDAMIRRLNR